MVLLKNEKDLSVFPGNSKAQGKQISIIDQISMIIGPSFLNVNEYHWQDLRG
jgi:hypothetical protein